MRGFRPGERELYERLIAQLSERNSELSRDYDGAEKSVVFNVYKHQFIQKWVTLLTRPEAAQELPSLSDDLVRTACRMMKELGRAEQSKFLAGFLKDLNRTLAFTSGTARHTDTLVLCQGAFRELLDEASAILPRHPQGRRKSDVRKQGCKLVQILAGGQIAVPRRFHQSFEHPLPGAAALPTSPAR